MMTTETETEFNGAFMNNGVNGVLDNKFQDPKMLYIKAFISTHFTDNRVMEEELLIKCECEDGGCSNCRRLCELIDNTKQQ